MRTRVVDVDILRTDAIEELAGYDAVEILFRKGGDPLGRARIPCNGDSLNLKETCPEFWDPSLVEDSRRSDGPLPTVTVVICTRDRPAELAEALRSLARQERPADEILVVDNSTQDEMRDLVQDILPHARYLRERQPGLDIARNRALWAATGDIIAFLDDDAEADPGWVHSVAESFAQLPEAAALTGLILPRELDTPAQNLFEASGGYGRGFSRRVLPRDATCRFGMRLPLVADVIGVGSGCNMAFRTEVLRQLDGFDNALDTGPPLPGGGDLDMMYRVIRAGHALVYEPRALVRHRHRRSEGELAAQLAGHHRSLTAWLVKTLSAERGGARVGVGVFLAWRLAKNGFRLVRRLAGRDVLPAGMLARMFVAGLMGLGSYQASRWRIAAWTRRAGGRRVGLTAHLVELWRFRQLIWNLTARDVKVKYQRSWLGFFWTLLNPLLTVGILMAVFSFVVRIPLPHYWAFLISGYFAWSFCSQTLNGGVQAAVGSAYLTRSAYFPQEVLIISSALTRLLEFLGEMAIVLVLLAFFHHKGLPVSFLFVIPLVPILFLLVLGLSLPVVTLAVYYDDVVQAVPLATMALFYASPVFYSVEMVPEGIRTIYSLNPLASLLGIFHTALYRGEVPDLGALIALALVAVVLAFAGYAVFNWKKREFAEIV